MIKIRERRDGKAVRLQAVIYALRPGEVKPERFRLNVPCTVTSKSGAQRWAEAVRRDIEAGKPPPQTREGRERAAAAKVQHAEVARKDMTMAAWCDAYLADCHARRVRPTTVALYRQRLSHVLAAGLGVRRVADFCELDWQRLRGQLAHMRASTANAILELVHFVLVAAHRAKLREAVEKPTRVRDPAEKQKRRPDAYTPEESELLVSTAARLGDHYLAVQLLGGEAGLRAGEICGLRAEDVAGVELTVKRTIVVIDGIRTEHPPKGGSERVVPASVRVQAVLARLAATSPDGWLVRSCRENEPIVPYHVTWYAAAVQRASGLPKKGPHKLRHSFASQALAAGADLETLRKILGQSNIGVTAMYLHSETGADRRAIDGLVEYRRQRTDGTAVARTPPMTLVSGSKPS